jgi:hypothetical protein
MVQAQGVSGGSNKRFSVRELPGAAVGTIRQCGTMLHSSGFLSDFKDLKPDRCIFFVPLEDGRMNNFFTGGGMERYMRQLVQQTVQRSRGTWHNE